MKSKKSIFLCLLLLTSYFPKENKYFVAFGDEIFSSVMKLISEEKNIYFEPVFLEDKSNYKNAFQYFEKRPVVYSSLGKKDFEKYIKKSEFIIFSYDIDDIYPDYISDKSIDNYKKILALFDYYLEKTYEDVSEIYKGKKLCLGMFSKIKNYYNNFLDELNDLIYKKSLEYNFIYISTTFLSNFWEKNKINEDGNLKLSKEIISKIYEL